MTGKDTLIGAHILLMEPRVGADPTSQLHRPRVEVGLPGAKTEVFLDPSHLVPAYPGLALLSGRYSLWGLRWPQSFQGSNL